MSTQPNWAQQAAAQSQKPGMNKNVMWGIIGGAILLVIAIVIAMTTTSSTTPATGKSVNVSKSVSIQGEALQKAENSTGVIDPTTDTAVGSSARCSCSLRTGARIARPRCLVWSSGMAKV